MEAIQQAALRIITGTKVGTKHFSLYRELDLPKLSARRYESRLVKLYEILNRNTPGRMNREDLESINERNPYPSRRGKDLTLPMVSTELCRTSFKHSGIRNWNALPHSMREANNKTVFKKIRHRPLPDPFYQYEYNRKGGILLALLRCNNPDLNNNLYSRNLKDSGECECGFPTETIEHYLLNCQLYTTAREDAKMVCHIGSWNCRDLLHGSVTCIRYNQHDNELISKTVQQFILATNRFK